MSEVLVIGHRNPDTDAICSAIGYAEFKRRTGLPNAVAARCGDTNERIDFVLASFGVPAPRFVSDVSPKVRDVMINNVVSVPPDATVAVALGVFDEHNIRVLPVLETTSATERTGRCGAGLAASATALNIYDFWLATSTRWMEKWPAVPRLCLMGLRWRFFGGLLIQRLVQACRSRS